MNTKMSMNMNMSVRHIIIAGAFALSAVALAGCSTAPTPAPPPGPANDFTLCSEALLAAGTSNPATLLKVALSTPACQALGQDVLQLLINSVGRQQARRGLR